MGVMEIFTKPGIDLIAIAQRIGQIIIDQTIPQDTQTIVLAGIIIQVIVNPVIKFQK
jgi:hypothetical protein